MNKKEQKALIEFTEKSKEAMFGILESESSNEIVFGALMEQSSIMLSVASNFIEEGDKKKLMEKLISNMMGKIQKVDDAMDNQSQTVN